MSLPPKDAEAVRATLRADPSTTLIAESLDLSLEEYIDQVMLFVQRAPATQTGSSGKSGFTPAYRPTLALGQARSAEGIDASKTDPALKADLAEQMRRNRNKKG